MLKYQPDTDHISFSDSSVGLFGQLVYLSPQTLEGLKKRRVKRRRDLVGDVLEPSELLLFLRGERLLYLLGD